MGKRSKAISKKQIDFIKDQKVFFVGTAAAEGRINVSPKGMDTLRVINPNKVIWLNLTGSGNETAAHLLQNSRMTIMFCAFEGNPLILRLYGNARTYHERDKEYSDFISLFPGHHGARQIIEFDIDLVQNSCGFGVPLYEFKEERTLLKDWAKNKGETGIKSYWEEKNTVSLDGAETGILNDQ